MLTFSSFCRALFLLGQKRINASGPRRGAEWEDRVARYLARSGAAYDTLPGGFRVLGHAPLSGLSHQIDGTVQCPDAIVICEWKAFCGGVPKNELLRFKAATDDFYADLGRSFSRTPIMRVFGGLGEASDSLRRYAALHGITIVEPSRWPAPVLAVDRTIVAREYAMPDADRRGLAWMSRSLQRVLIRQRNGALLVPCPPPSARLNALLLVHDVWSGRAWDVVDTEPGRFERMVAPFIAERAA